MLYDCFIFSFELELLDLRLAYLNDTVDFFVIVESAQTLTGHPKKLIFKENKKRYEKYEKKIIYLECPTMPGMSAWEYEYFQRNYIKEALVQCNDNDLVLVSDVDEIVNLKCILAIPGLTFPVLIDLPLYYYFFNLKSRYSFAVNLLARYEFVKNFNIGRRIPDYSLKIDNIILKGETDTGWHFSYLFGFQVEKYVEKVKSFSHQEYNTPYYLDSKRIINCVKLGIDLFERGNVDFKFKKPEDCLQQILPVIKELNLGEYVYFPERREVHTFRAQWFILRKKVIPNLWSRLSTYARRIVHAFLHAIRKQISYLKTNRKSS